MSDHEATPSLNPNEVAEADQLRSQVIRKLIAESSAALQSERRPRTPQLLVQFWDDASAVPEDVQGCLDSWAPLEEAGFERRLFDDTSARHFIEDYLSSLHARAFDRCVHPAMRADYFRLCFMVRIGGLYVDADDEYQSADLGAFLDRSRLQLQALCYDIASDSMIDAAEAAGDLAAAPGRIFYVNNNPLIAEPEHPVIVKALERSTALLLAASRLNRDIQALTGPGNLTASLVAHVAEQDGKARPHDFELLTDWNAVAVSKWPLHYRADERNWRNWANSDRTRDP